MNKSHIYGLIPNQLKSLAGQIITKNNLLKKSKDEKPLDSTAALQSFERAVNSTSAANELGEMLFLSFKELKSDYDNARIPFTRFSEYLKKYKDFFEVLDLNKTDVPETLHADQILMEIKKYLN